MKEILTFLNPDHIKRSKQWVDIARAYYEVDNEAKLLTKRASDLKKKLIELSEHQNSIGGGFKFTCIKQSGRVDYNSIPELEKVDLDMYRGAESERWQLKKV
jgi:hypothetical protein